MALYAMEFWTSPGHPGQVALAVARGETTRNLTFSRAVQAGLSYIVKLLRSTVGTSEPKLLDICPSGDESGVCTVSTAGCLSNDWLGPGLRSLVPYSAWGCSRDDQTVIKEALQATCRARLRQMLKTT